MSNIKDIFGLGADPEDDKGKKPGNEYYVGGKSGQNVIAPKNAMEEIVQKAQQNTGTTPEKLENSKKITLYKNGFIIDNGEFRSLEKDYQKGINIFKDSLYPKEFEEEIQRTNQPISVALENKITEDFIEPFKAFRGSGHTLKSVESKDQSGLFKYENPSSLVTLDNTKPKTTIKLKLITKIITQEFNTDNTIMDIVNFIRTQTPNIDFSLLSGYPPKPIIDCHKTIQEAGLIGAQLTQKGI